MTSSQRQTVLMFTVVWGDWHVNALLGVCLPTLLAPGNLPAFAANHHVRHIVYTTKADGARMQAAPVFRQLCDLVETTFETIPAHKLDSPIQTHHEYWQAGLVRAAAEKAFAMPMYPDAAWSDRVFSHLGDIIASGRKAVFMNFLRVTSETFVPALAARYAADGNAMRVPPRELVRLGLEHAHPLTCAYLPDSGYFPTHPEYLIRAVPGEGLSVRQLNRELFIFDTRRFKANKFWLLDEPFAEDEVYLILDSDLGFGVGFSPLGKDFGMHETPQGPSPISIGRWWRPSYCRSTDYFVGRPLRWHVGDVTERKWRAAETASALLATRAVIVREALAAWEAANELGCRSSGALLAFFMARGDLSDVFNRTAVPFHVFMPSDEAFAAVGEGYVHHLCTPEGAADRRAFLRRHIAFANGAGGNLNRQMTSADGSPVRIERQVETIRVNGHDVIGSPVVRDRATVYAIDGILPMPAVETGRRGHDA